MVFKLESKVVCRICFESSRDKTKPRITIAARIKSGFCPTCKHQWNQIVIARECRTGAAHPFEWFSVRPRPKIPSKSDYHICQHSDRHTSYGSCQFAHSEIELKYWTKQRAEEEPRCAPPSTDYHKHCRMMLNSGICNAYCFYAHSSKELELWITNPFKPRPPPPKPPNFEYQMCSHVSSMRRCPVGNNCKFAHTTEELNSWKLHIQPVRPTPLLPPGVSEYRLCWYISSHQRCKHGAGCKFAHSIYELSEWNKSLQSPNQYTALPLPDDFAFQIRKLIVENYCKNQKLCIVSNLVNVW